MTGDVEDVPAGTPLAVAVNGRIAATTRAFRDRGKLQFAALIPPDSLRPGENTITVVRVP